MSNWENNIIKELASDYVKEKRRKRRWGIFFKSLFFIWLFLTLFALFSKKDHLADSDATKQTALINIRGGIFEGGHNTADNIVSSLRRAFKDKKNKGIILRINSPGGSPVQANYVFQEVMRLRKLHPNVKVYAVCVDLCASAAYYIAAAANEIYADRSSLVGSIGVLYNGFGFTQAMKTLGIDRRLITAGKNKGFLDPFSPANEKQTKELKKMLALVHKEFINNVKKGRGDRLKNTPDIFSGLFWTGIQAKEKGLIDNFGSPGYVAREVIKAEKIVDYTKKYNYFEKLAKQFTSSISNEINFQLGMSQHSIVGKAL